MTAPDEMRTLALNALKFKMNSAAKVVAESAVQLHGGIGMTQESMVGRLFAQLTAKRLTAGDSLGCMNRLMTGTTSIALT